MKQKLILWEPENRDFWERHGKAIAARNLWTSSACLLLSFAVWVLWSMVVVRLPDAGFPYTTNQLFWLAALPGLTGAALRFVFAFMVPLWGGRRWTVFSTALLLLPALGIGFALQSPQAPYPLLLLLAALCGIGGGNFASSMAHISYFFPRSQQGLALGVNAGLGNLGVTLAQFIVPLVIALPLFGAMAGLPVRGESGGRLWLQNAGFIWVVPILLAGLAAWLWMDDVAAARASIREQFTLFRTPHTWALCWLYVGSFGSYLGFTAGFPLLAHILFPATDLVGYAFLGPLVGALFRPLGGWLADTLGRARVSGWTFALLILGGLGVIHYLPGVGAEAASPWGFLSLFLLLFAAAGASNGAVFSMVPGVYHAFHLRRAEGGDHTARCQALHTARREAATALGVISALGAFGAFFIPKSYGTSIALTGTPAAALWVAVIFYFTCLLLTAWYAARDREDAE